MAKLRLDLDRLTVDSFDTADTRAKKGTVFGEQCTCYTQCTCPGCPTCDATCDTCDWTCEGDTCQWSCGGSCYFSECHTCDTCNPTIANGLPCCL